MRKKYRFVTLRIYDYPEILKFLENYKVNFTINEKAMNCCEFYLYSDMENAKQIFSEVKVFVDKKITSGFSLINIENEFTKEELDQAEWISIEVNTRFQYAQPMGNDNNFRQLYFEKSEGCDSCGFSYIQTDYFSLKKSLKFTGKRQVTGLLNVMGELFINGKIKNSLEESDLMGFEIWPVYNEKRTEFLKDTYQLYIKEKSNISMEPESYSAEYICELCGKKYYRMNEDLTQLIYKEESLSNIELDIVKSKESLGRGLYGPEIIISHKMYLFFKKHNMIKNLRINIVILKD